MGFLGTPHACDAADLVEVLVGVDVELQAGRAPGPCLRLLRARIEDALDLALEDFVVEAGAVDVIVALAELEAFGAAEHLGDPDRSRRTLRPAASSARRGPRMSS